MNPDTPHAPLFGPAVAAPSRREQRLLDIVRRHPENETDDFAARHPALAPELVSLRRNILPLVPVRPTDAVLEIGAGAGALTGALAATAGRVTAFEPSPALARANAVRHRDASNLEVHCGPLEDMAARLGSPAFDLILALGIPDPAPTPQTFSGLLPWLNPDGLLAASAACMSRTEWETFAREAGFQGLRFFHACPNRIFPETLHSDEIPPPSSSSSDRIVHLRRRPFASEAPHLLYAKCSTLRRPSLRIVTEIRTDAEGRRIVRKRPAAPEARSHIESLPHRTELFSRLLEGPPFVSVPCVLRDGAAESEFIAGPTLAARAAELLRQGNREAFLKLFSDFAEAVQSLATDEFRPTSDFNAHFGPVDLPSGLKSAPVTNLDLILSNLIVRDGSWHVADAEWIFEFPIPAGFVLYRAIKYFWREQPAAVRTHPGLHRDLYRICGIGSELRAYRRMERAFQRHICPDLIRRQALLARFPDSAATGSAMERFLARHLPPRAVDALVRLKAVFSDRP